MKNTDKRVDDYIEKAQDFAKPILIHMRQLIHKACPDVQETWKWSFPNFGYKGEMMCHIASFKQHCAFGFWKAAIMEDKKNVLEKQNREAMGHMGRITTLKDLPSDKIIIALVKQAMKLNDEGKKLPPRKKASDKEKKELKVPADFLKAISKNKKALATFNAFSYSNKKEYIEWITEAKTEETKEKRMATAVDWMEDGKSRHWKYKNC
ncbi:MAG: YdeI/OmpD-associated family protein [Bacteroidia bacterium]|nr:YdeI/OmpD-associated family protein [Bacteroidia bacterium]